MKLKNVIKSVSTHYTEFKYATAIFAVTFLLGIIGYIEFAELIDTSTVSDLGYVFESDNFSTVNVLINNLLTTSVSAVGAIAVGIPTLINLLINGLVLGITFGISLTSDPQTVFLATLLPHSIIEIPAFLLASAVGLRFPRLLIKYLTESREYILHRNELRQMITVIGVSIVLIVLAAVVEGYVTPKIVEVIAN